MAWLVEELDAAFLAHLETLKDVALANADASCGVGQRTWYVPPLNEWSGDPLDLINMKSAFDRTAINTLYVQVVSNTDQDGRIGEAMLLKLQLDYIAALERSYRTRHASSVRCRIHAAARRAGHASSGGLFDTGSGTIALWLTRLLAAAHSDPEEE